MPDAVESLGSNYAALGETLISMGRLEEACTLADSLLRLPRSLTGTGLTANASELLILGRRLHAQAALEAGRNEAVSAFFRPDVRFAPSTGSPREIAQSHYWMGLALCALERTNEALTLEHSLEKAARTHADDPFITERFLGLRYFRPVSYTHLRAHET